MTSLNRRSNRRLCEELAVAYIATQDTPHAEYAKKAANNLRARVLTALAGEEDLLKFVIEFVRVEKDGES